MRDPKILMIEDNPGDVALVEELLRSAPSSHATLFHDETLSDALATLRATMPDAILLDLNLPDSSGIGTLRKVRSVAPDAPIIVFTGLDDESTGLLAIREGAQDYLVKGEIDSRLLTRTVRYAIERKHLEMEKDKLVKELQELLGQVKTLRGLLPMCAWCKKIRDERGEWHMLESYIQDHSSADVTHGICPECAAEQKKRVGL
jgi:DNA-binding response OmpR family regulator